MIREIQYANFVEEKPFVKEWIDDKGKEVLSSQPVAIPIQSVPSPASMVELIHRMYVQLRQEGTEVETFEDAEDFDVPDELGIEMRNTPYEQDFDHIEVPAEPAPQPSSVSADPDKSQKVDPA